ncbi:MAG: hypothetical protein AAF441_17655 [Pseudomonadota bacterium]
MNFKTFAIAAAAAASIAIAAPASANASEGFTNTDLVQQVGGKHFGKKRHFHGKHFGWGGGHYWGHRPYYHGFGGCGYFYKKAKWTGSRYWWKKYKRCAHGYY